MGTEIERKFLVRDRSVLDKATRDEALDYMADHKDRLPVVFAAIFTGNRRFVMATTGAATGHATSSRPDWFSLIIRPQSAAGGWTPRPR